MRNAPGQAISYHITETERGRLFLAKGVGKERKLNDRDTLDLYAKYLYTHVNGQTVQVERELKLNALTSNRLKLGGRWTREVTKSTAFYVGLGMQYEFSGKAKGVVAALGDIPAPSLHGFSAFGELGLIANNRGPFSLDLGLTGWTGKQSGVQFHGTAKWRF